MDDDEELSWAASILVEMKHSVLDRKSARQLIESMDKVPTRVPSPILELAPPPVLPARLRFSCERVPCPGVISGCKLYPKLVEPRNLVGEYCSIGLEKVLTTSDTKKGQLRLLFPKEYAVRYVNKLAYRDCDDPMKGVEVTVYDHRGTTYEMRYKTWADKKSNVLTTPRWRKLLKACNFCAGDKIYFWAFRPPQQNGVCFAILGENQFT